jgi:tripartite-type tricarboxylate transporter receptor subunit TctC
MRRDSRVPVRIAAITASAIAFLLSAAPALPQSFPSKAIHLVVPYPPGGGVDGTARTLAPKLAELLGQPVIVDNRPGAAGTVGADYVAKAPAEGYVLLVGGRGPTSAAPLMHKKLPYVPARDLTAVSNLVLWPYILVTHPSLPARNARELIALATSRPGELNMASGGAGSGQHISGELFNLMAGTRMTHVPYKGTGPAINDIMGGHADLGFLDPAVLPQIRSGRLKALGVSSEQRYEPLPNVPPISESGLPGYVSVTWYGLMAPTATPKDVIARLNAEIGRALVVPEVKEKLLAQGLVASPSTPGQLTARIRADSELLDKLIRASGIQVN